MVVVSYGRKFGNCDNDYAGDVVVQGGMADDTNYVGVSGGGKL